MRRRDLDLVRKPRSRSSGQVGAQRRNPDDPELRLDFVTPVQRDGRPVVMPELNFAFEPQKFME